jgi:hypothetical protein
MKGLVRVGIAAAIVVALLSFGAVPALATHVSCGQVITQSIKFDNDLLNCPPELAPFRSAIVIGADNVTLDLAGHTIESGVPIVYNTVGVDNSAGYDGLTVKNGSILGFERSIIAGGDGNVVTKTNLVGRGGVIAQGATNLQVRKNVVTGGALDGILLEGTGEVEHNVVTDALYGIYAIGGFVAHNLVEHNDVGIEAAGSTTVSHNTANFNGYLGIEATSSVVDGGGNKAEGNGGSPLQCVNVFCK